MKRLSFLIVFASLMLFSFGLAQAATEITLDNMTGLHGGDSVIMGESVRWDFRLNYTPGDGSRITGSTNGFEVYTVLNGAYTDNFTAITYDTFPWNWKSLYDLVFTIGKFSIDGLGADTVGFGGAKLFGPGIVDGTDSLCWWIETTPSTDGDTLCIDSAFYPPGGEWIWSTNGVLGVFTPDWGGPYCFYVHDTSKVPASLVVTPDTLYFTAEEGGANPNPDIFTVSEAGGGAIAFTLAETSGWFDLDKTDGTTPEDVEVSVDITGLSADVYFDSVTVTSGEATNSPQFAYIRLEVTEAPKFLEVTPDTLYFTAEEGGANPDPDTFTVSEAGGGAIAFTLAETSVWFNLDKSDGTTPEAVEVSVDITGLTADIYFDSVTVTSGEADNSPIYEFISLIVTLAENDPPVLDFIGSKDVNEGDTLRFTVTASDPNGTTPSLSAENRPSGADFADNGDGTGDFVWVPNFDQANVYYVTFIASDGELADSELVEITVNNTNRPPEIDPVADTTIDECDTLELTFSAIDPDGDSIILETDTLYENMTFNDNGDGTADFYFAPSPEQAGIYTLVIYANDGTDVDSAIFTITVEECGLPPECVDMILSDTVFHFVDTLENGGRSASGVQANLDITSSGDEFCFEIYPYLDTTSTWLTLSDSSGCTPATVTLTADGSGMSTGTYQNVYAVLGDSTVCDPNPQYFVVILEVVDTTTPPPPAGDTLTVATVSGVPGAQVVVPVDFVNQCDLIGILAWLEWYSDHLVLDSVSWIDTRLHEFVVKVDSIFNESNTVLLLSVDDTAVVAPGEGNFVNLYFTVAAEAPAGFYEIGFKPMALPQHPAFTVICDQGIEIIEPEAITGGIVVDTSGNFVCGYVVDTNGIPIPGAVVELWPDFPYGAFEDMTITSSSGAFAFHDFTTMPFDLYAYHEGYYPGLAENINFSQIGIMIVLTPVEEVYPTYEWVFFYCEYNEYMGVPLPVGSVIDAYDSNGVHCGTHFVTHVGQYGYMPVYRDDSLTTPDIDEGADPGETIRFYINGIEAIVTGGNPTWTEHLDTNQACLEAGEIVTTTCDLVEGWNLVSWTVAHATGYLPDVLTSIESCLELVMGFEQGALIYDPGLPQFSTLWNVDPYSGYWIKTSCPVTLEITGTVVPTATPIPVTTGWNLVSYLPDFQLAPEEALASIHDDLIVALGFDGLAGLIYLPGDPFSTLTEMSPCGGYWVKVTQDGNLVYPATGPVIAAPQKSDVAIMSAAVPDVAATNSWINVYGHNLTIDGETVCAGAVVTAHTRDGIKIGSFTMGQDGLFGFMPVYADDNSTPEIEGVRAGEQFYLSVNGVKTNETFAWTKAGDKMEIGALTAKTTSEPVLPEDYSLHQNYPNPFNPTTNIGFTLPVAGKARIDIYNILGKLVATPFDGMANSGTNEVVWDGRNFAGETVATGIYFYRLSADNYVETRKMTLLK